MNKHGIYPSTLAEEYGFQKGDKVLTVNGQDFEAYHELQDSDVYAKAGNTFKVLRNGKELIIRVPQGDLDVTLRRPFLELMDPIEIDSVLTGFPAEQIHLQRGDRIVRVNDIKIDRLYDMQHIFSTDLDGSVDLQIQRIEKTDTLVFASQVKLDPGYRLGIITRAPINYTVKSNSFSEAFEKGVMDVFKGLAAGIRSWLGLWNPGTVSGGPVSISTISAYQPKWELFWYLTASFATFFVTWNLLPFPRSAFWEVIPLVYEGVTKKIFPYSLFRSSRLLAWFIFWGLILFTFVMDISRLF